MKKTLLLILITSLAFVGIATGQPKPELAPLTILHWNDFHAHNEPYKIANRNPKTKKDTSYFVGGTAYVVAYLNKFKKESQNTLVLNAGDDFQGTPISSYTLGRSQIELMNVISPDAMTLGNHEFDYGSERLRSNIKLAHFPILSANIFDIRNNKTFVEPARIIEKGKIKIGLIGLEQPSLETLVIKDSLVGIAMLNVDSVVNEHVRNFKNHHVDLIVALTHFGVEEDSLLAHMHPEINVIVGGHSHTALFAPKKVNRTIIVQAGQWGEFVGKLDLMVDLSGDSVYSYSGKLIETRNSEIAPDPVAANKVESLVSSLRGAMSEIIGELKTEWVEPYGKGHAENNLGNWESDVMKEYAGTDVVFQNSTGIRFGLKPGPIKVGDIWQINPFGNHCVIFTVTGGTLRSMVEFQVSRARHSGFVHFSGLRLVFDSRRLAGQRVVSIEVNGKPVNDKAVYTVATNNYVSSNLEVHFGIDSKSLKFTSLPKLDRDIFIDKIRKEKIISSFLDGRIKDLANEQK